MKRESVQMRLHDAIESTIRQSVGGLFRQFLKPSDGQITVNVDTLRTWANRAERLEQAANNQLLEENDRLREALSQSWTHYLEVLMDSKLDDGTPVINAVFYQNPELVQRLKRAILR